TIAEIRASLIQRSKIKVNLRMNNKKTSYKPGGLFIGSPECIGIKYKRYETLQQYFGEFMAKKGQFM
ncbi:MAG TPA: hypothetical protein PK200_01485, partial [Spirochaetota bacterium]|nr:hypothetical protein [Spirochaetota bacterium]